MYGAGQEIHYLRRRIKQDADDTIGELCSIRYLRTLRGISIVIDRDPVTKPLLVLVVGRYCSRTLLLFEDHTMTYYLTLSYRQDPHSTYKSSSKKRILLTT